MMTLHRRHMLVSMQQGALLFFACVESAANRGSFEEREKILMTTDGCIFFFNQLTN